MTNQTHLLFRGDGVGSNDSAAPRTHNVMVRALFLNVSMVLLRQHDLLCSSLETNPVPVLPALT